ncbi:MAG: M15 family metallopeptidase, partial [Abditibacteriota bacterium]|nr:M15 family metallopeptidase [Abditibacteriota bacterium]
LRPGAREACECFLKECQASGLDIFITETYRSQERQNELYAQGRTKPGKVVTWTTSSNHTGRQAWDVSFKSTGYDELSKFYMAGEIAESLGITWGGSWKKQDLPHFEYKEDKFMPTARIEAEQLADAALKAGIITDRALWIRYMTGEAALTPGNLRALFAKVLAQK